MKVYLVIIGWDYEGSKVMGVHQELTGAEKQKTLLESKRYGDFVEIEEWEIGQAKEDLF